MDSEENKIQIDLNSPTLLSDVELHGRMIRGYAPVDMREYNIVLEDNKGAMIDYPSLSNYVRDCGYVRHLLDKSAHVYQLYIFDNNTGYYTSISEESLIESLIVELRTHYPELRFISSTFKKNVEFNVIPFIRKTDELIKTEEYLALEGLYTDGEVIPFKNGFYSLRYNRFLPRTACRFTLNPLCVDFNPYSIKNSIGEKYLEMMQDEDTFEYLFQQIGYAMYATTFVTPTYTVLYGNGANGKSIVLDTIMKIVGEDNISMITLEDMTNSHIVAQSENKKINIVSDSGEGYRESAFRSISAVPSFMKTASGGEKWIFNPKNKQPRIGKPPSKFIFASNNYLNLGDSSGGTTRRLHAVPFMKTFKDDFALAQRFKGREEVEWFAMQALISFKNFIHNAMQGEEDIPFSVLKGEYSECKAGDGAKKEMMLANNILDDYINTVLELDILNKEEVRQGMIGIEDLYLDFKDYCYEMGRNKVPTQTWVTQYLKSTYRLVNARKSYRDGISVKRKYVIESE